MIADGAYREVRHLTYFKMRDMTDVFCRFLSYACGKSWRAAGCKGDEAVDLPVNRDRRILG